MDRLIYNQILAIYWGNAGSYEFLMYTVYESMFYSKAIKELRHLAIKFRKNIILLGQRDLTDHLQLNLQTLITD